MATRRWTGALSALCLGVSVTASGEEVRRLSVDEAVKEALEASDNVRAADLRVESSQATAASARGRMLPSINVHEEFLHYNSPFVVAFPFPLAPGGAIAFPARSQNTNTFSVSASQPIVGLAHLGHEYGAAEKSVDASRAQAQTVESATREAVETGILRLYEARSQQEIAHTSVAQLQEQLDDARSKFTAGVLTKADVLRFETAVANARQQEIQAGVQELVTKASLLTGLGRNVRDTSVDFQAPEVLEKRAAEPLPEPERASEWAITTRPEVFQAQAEAQSALLNARARGLALLPEVNVVAAYANVQGQIFAQVNAAYIGVQADWPIWDWGGRYFAHRSAYKQALASLALEENQRRQVALDATTKLEEARAAGVAIEVAEKAIASAEEAYRVTQALVTAGTATTTDLLDSQSALTQAKQNWVRARYERAIARVELERAIGH